MIHIYHPSKTIKGFAASFWYSERDNTVFATLLKQSGWDEQAQNGTFKDSMNDPTKKVNVKFSSFEVAAILDCIERNRPFSTFHDNDESPKTIGFGPWKDNKDGTQKGFSFSVTVGNKQDSSVKNPFYIGLSFAEARLIREFLINAIHRSFNRQSEGYTPSQKSPTPAQTTQTQAVEAPAEPEKKDGLLDF